MLCPLCNQKRARRSCPALGVQICPVCCGTKRLTEIRCPSDCVYLASAREHPAAATVRQQQHDLAWLVSHVRDLNERQSQLFFLVSSFLARYDPGDLHAPIDADVVEGVGALAATLETAARGVIYEHRPASIPAERLVAALKPVLDEVGAGGGTAFERDAAVVLRRIEAAAREVSAEPRERSGRRAFLDLLARIIKKPTAGEQQTSGSDEEDTRPGSRLILP